MAAILKFDTRKSHFAQYVNIYLPYFIVVICFFNSMSILLYHMDKNIIQIIQDGCQIQNGRHN
jgi:membrane protein insertase Oxa1/YidC/SpoIIIJ